jgi:hypothetical protein
MALFMNRFLQKDVMKRQPSGGEEGKRLIEGKHLRRQSDTRSDAAVHTATWIATGLRPSQ